MRRTQGAALVAWAAGTGALAAALYPALAAALLAFLAGLVMVATMRTSLRGGLVAALGAGVPLVFADRTLSAMSGTQGDVPYLALGLALLLVSAVVADTASATTAAPHAEAAERRDEIPAGTERALDRNAGLRRAEWELARATAYHRQVALALIGVDVSSAGPTDETRRELMGRLDELVRESLTSFDLVCEYGPRELLMLLPEESASRLGDPASQLCAVATERLGRNVRMALASFPDHGLTLRALLMELEVDLAACRLHETTVRVCELSVAQQAAPSGERASRPDRDLDEPPTRPLPVGNAVDVPDDGTVVPA